MSKLGISKSRLSASAEPSPYTANLPWRTTRFSLKVCHVHKRLTLKSQQALLVRRAETKMRRASSVMQCLLDQHRGKIPISHILDLFFTPVLHQSTLAAFLLFITAASEFFLNEARHFEIMRSTYKTHCTHTNGMKTMLVLVQIGLLTAASESPVDVVCRESSLW